MKIANVTVIAASPEPAISEPISPELVLVDPELRRALRTLAFERAPLQVVPDPEPAPLTSTPERSPVPPATLIELPLPPAPLATPPAVSVPETAPAPSGGALRRRRRHLVSALLPISLSLNAILITLAVSDATVAPRATAPPPSLDATLPGKDTRGQTPSRKTRRQARGAKSGAAPKSSAAKRGPSRQARQVVHARDGALERRLLNLIVQAPAGKLPRALINRKTGLAKNNLQAVCRRESGSRSVLCVVQPARHKPGEGLYARYRLNRKGTGGTFTWYPYRSS
jgi:hypothetical protein